MYLLKKIIAPFFLPVPLCLEILLLGLFMLWFTRKQRVGKLLVTMGVILLISLSYTFISKPLMKHLENKYDSLIELKNYSDIKFVVVLGSGHETDPKVPITSQLTNTSLVRLIEGIRILNMLPESKLVLSGGKSFGLVSNAKVMSGVAIVLGVDVSDVILESISRDTKDEARLVNEIVGKNKFILVTSASHMPRSIALFRKLGMFPIPAPTDFWVKESKGEISPGMFFPNARGLRMAERVFYEYLGLIWARLRGQT